MNKASGYVDRDDEMRMLQEGSDPTSQQLGNHYVVDVDEEVRRWINSRSSVADSQ